MMHDVFIVAEKNSLTAGKGSWESGYQRSFWMGVELSDGTLEVSCWSRIHTALGQSPTQEKQKLPGGDTYL